MVRSLLGQVFLHLLVAGDALEPAEGRDHAQKQRQFGVLRDAALLEKDGLLRVEAGSKVVKHDFAAVRLDIRGVGVVRCKGVPVGDEEIALVLAAVLQLDPVGEGSHVVAQVQLARWAHAA